MIVERKKRKLLKVLLLWIILNRLLNAEGTKIPNRAWASEEIGVYLEPQTLILHYEDLSYMTVGIQFGLAPFKEDVDGSERSSCNFGPIRDTVISRVNKSISDFFNHIPRQFDKLSDHYCQDDTFDCFFSQNTTVVPNIGEVFRTRTPKKRAAPAVLAAIVGIAALGGSIYRLVSDYRISSHLAELEEMNQNQQRIVTKILEGDKQYRQLSENIFHKIQNGMMSSNKLLLNSICSSNDNSVLNTVYLEYELFLEEYKNKILKAIDGEVDDFLITNDLLDAIINQYPQYKGTVFKKDPGMFYLTSSSILTKIDFRRQVLYFTIMTPLLKERDVSPLYNVNNFGWLKDDVRIRLSLPRSVYFLTDNNQVHIAVPALDRCQKVKNIFMCHLRESIIDKQSQCLTKMIMEKDVSNCSYLVDKADRTCLYMVLGGGVAVMGCDYITLVTYFRGIPAHKRIQINREHSNFFDYNHFHQIIIGENIIQSRGTIMISNPKANSIPHPTLNITDIKHLITPGLAQDLDSLHQLQKTSEETISGYLKGIYQKKQESHHIIIISIILLTVLNICLIYFLWRCKKSQAPSLMISDVQDLNELRRRRDGIFL